MLLHPPVVQFPAVLFLAGLVVAFLPLCFRNAFSQKTCHNIQDILVASAALSVLLAYLTGLYDSADLSSLSLEAKSALERHQFIGKALLFLLVPLLSLLYLRRIAPEAKQKVLQNLLLALVIVFVLLSFANNYFGGQIVFEHGIGVTSSGQ